MARRLTDILKGFSKTLNELNAFAVTEAKAAEADLKTAKTLEANAAGRMADAGQAKQIAINIAALMAQPSVTNEVAPSA